jgi:hypothetical protein
MDETRAGHRAILLRGVEVSFDRLLEGRSKVEETNEARPASRLTTFVGEERVEDTSEPFHRFGESLGTPVETRQVISNGTVEALHQMGFGFRDEVRFAHPMTLERFFVARISGTGYSFKSLFSACKASIYDL